LPGHLLYPFVRLGARLFGHFDPDENSAIESVRNCKVPAIFFHGADDDFVPCEMSVRNYTVCASRKKLVIAGGASDSEGYFQSLKQMAAGNQNIIFTGFVQGKLLSELYSSAYAYVLPSEIEGMPLSLLEAMSYGNCCLTSTIPECTEVVEDHAVVFQKGDVADLARTLQRLCDEPQTVAGYQAGARDFICEKYNWDLVASQTMELYHENFADQQVSVP
jgi:glycosyltransferase involved in cell wall biosynthesis